jgi:selenium metabolism protein YedF
MKVLDCKGFACPKPVILTKKEFENKELSELEVIVDNDAASINVSKFAASIGVNSEIVKKDGLIHVILTRGENLSTSEGKALGSTVASVNATESTSTSTESCELMDFTSKEELVILVSSDKLGVGDDKLGAALMKSYLYALTESDKKPKVMLFLNGGVKLTAEGSDVIESIKTLESLGTEILSCGTCLDFYGLKEKLLIGTVTNMYTIIEKMHHATNTIKL